MAIKVIDSIMGSGKSTWAMTHMKNNIKTEKFIYITPFLEEVDRIKRFIMEFKSPEDQGFMTKSGHLMELIKEGNNIAMSHELLKSLSKKQLNKLSNYTLILDETLDLISVYKEAGIKDIELLIEAETIIFDSKIQKYFITEKGKEFLKNGDDGKKTKLYKELQLIAEEKLYLYGGKTLICELPKEIILSFKDVYIMTYLFEGSVAYAFIEAHKISYEKYQIIKTPFCFYTMIPYCEKLMKRRAQEYMRLICLHMGKYNIDINNKVGSLSYRAQNRMKVTEKKELEKIIRNYFLSIGCSEKDVLWSTFKQQDKNKVEVKGFKKRHLVYNSRATNNYRHTSTLAYCIDKNNNPVIRGYLSKYEVKINEEKLAMDVMLQWIFRSRIRDKQPINLFLPSLKMRELLIKWGE